VASSRKTFAALVARKVGAVGVDLGGLNVEDFVSPAVGLYERVRPRIVTEDIAGAGVQRYATPAKWVVDASEFLSVEYPIDEDPPTFLDPNEVQVLDVADVAGAPTQKLLLGVAPSTGTSFRLRYTAPHTVDATTSSVPARDEEAVANYGAHLLCLELLTRFMGARAAADVAAEIALAQAEKMDAVRRAAGAFLEAADRLCGVASGEDGKRQPVFCDAVDVDVEFGPEGFQTHPPEDR
jgi:hypothetical protein